MLLLNFFHTNLLKFLYQLLRVYFIVSKNHTFREPLVYELQNFILAEIQKMINIALQLQILKRRIRGKIQSIRQGYLLGQVHGNVQVHGVNDENIQKLALAHEQIYKIRYEIFLILPILDHQQSHLYCVEVLSNLIFNFEKFNQIIRARHFSLRKLLASEHIIIILFPLLRVYIIILLIFYNLLRIHIFNFQFIILIIIQHLFSHLQTNVIYHISQIKFRQCCLICFNLLNNDYVIIQRYQQANKLEIGFQVNISKFSQQYKHNSMALCKRSKKARPPLLPREGQYKLTNAYTSKPSIQQILTFCLAILTIVLHSVFIVSPIIKINHPILYIMLALNYALVALLIAVYVRITVFDPVDTFIIDSNKAEYQLNYGSKNLIYCSLCRSYVHEKSYHCKRCKRCTEDFDHHCVFLNNCIGSRNYELFMIILMIYILFLVNNIGQAIWVFVVARTDSAVRQASITQWMVLAIIILCFLQLIATVALLSFHCYISCCLDLTTIAFYQSQTQSNHSERDRNQNQPKPALQNDASPIQLMRKNQQELKQGTFEQISPYK